LAPGRKWQWCCCWREPFSFSRFSPDLPDQLHELSELIRTGKLDFILLLPSNTRFMISFRQVDLGGFRQRRLCGRGDDLRGQSARIVADLGAGGRVCPAGCGEYSVHYSLMFLLASVSFWTVPRAGSSGATTTCSTSRGCPTKRSEVCSSLLHVCTADAPVANVPVKLLVHKLSSPLEMLVAAGMAVVWPGGVRKDGLACVCEALYSASS